LILFDNGSVLSGSTATVMGTLEDSLNFRKNRRIK